MSWIIRPTPPYDFPLSVSLFSSGDPQIRAFRKGHLTQLVRSDGRYLLADLSGSGTLNKPLLSLALQSETYREPDAAEVRRVKETIAAILNLRLDLTMFYEAVSRDPILTGITSRLYGLKTPRTQTVFEALVDSIIEQQISIRVARSLRERLIREFGEQVTIQGRTYYAFPDFPALAAGTDERFRSCGMSRRKGEYIRGVAEKISEGSLNLEQYRTVRDTGHIIEELCEIRGIGRWTAELTVLRSLGRLDAVPADDLGIRRVIGRYYGNGTIVTGDEARRIAEQWGIWKGLAAFYLITAEMQGIPPA